MPAAHLTGEPLARERRRRLFACQLYGRRRADPIAAVRHLVAIQTQYCQSLTGSLAVRGIKSGDAWAVRTLKPGSPIIKTWSVRHTLHTLADDTDALIRRVTSDRSLKRYYENLTKGWGFDAAQQRSIEARLIECLADGPKTRKEIHAAIPEFQGLPGVGWGGDVFGLATQGRLAICSHMGATAFYLKEPNVADVPCAQAAGEVLRRYLRAFGSATRADFAYWSGFRAPEVAAAFSHLDVEGVLVTLDTLGKVFILNEPVPDVRSPRLLLTAKFDSLVMGHKEKSFYLPPALRPRVFRKAGQVEACVFKNGQVAGTWRASNSSKGMDFTVEAWENLTPKDYDAVESALERMASKLGQAHAAIRFIVGTL